MVISGIEDDLIKLRIDIVAGDANIPTIRDDWGQGLGLSGADNFI